MLLGIDHIVIAVRDPDAAAEAITDHVGLAAGGGGRHPRLGTYNRLIWLGDSYLELMGVADPSLARTRPIAAGTTAALDDGREGVVSFAIATDSIAADVATLRGLGAGWNDPEPGERRRPDGEVVRWSVALPERLGLDGLPFLIEHELAGAEWGEPARAERAEVVHPFGGKAVLARLEFGVADPAAAAARHHEGVGLAVLAEDDGTLDLPIGANLLRFVPIADGAPATTVTIVGTAGQPRSVDLFGCRFLLEVAGIGSDSV